MYHDFYALRDLLLLRFRGLYIPILPPKKMLNNKDASFIEERRYLL